jgi:Tfp pilus assembly protein PilE
MYTLPNERRGFTLILAVILTSVVLAVSLALLDIAYKQVILASTARQSQYAFYAADSALECALYYDEKLNLFDYTAGALNGQLTCEGQTFNYAMTSPVGSSRTVTFSIPCTGGGSNSNVTIYKTSLLNRTTIDAVGYNTCSASSPQRVERGEKASY